MGSVSESAGSLKLSNLSAQPGVSRNAWSGDAILKWKANLTALSQCENLYFIALKDTIYADRPSFPDQRLGVETPVHDLRWRIASSPTPAKRGFHNRRYPHGVNRLEVAFLGDQEILVCACDDGDVIIYPVSGVAAAFEAIDSGIGQPEAVEKHIRPLFQYNVGISAWGIAVERKTRLIAISSNDHAVHMMAAALTPAVHTSRHSDLPQIPRLRLPGDTEDLDRATEARWKLSAHRTNIPSVAFHLSDDAEPSVFLLSSDTDSNIFVWNITEGSQIVHKISPTQMMATRQYGWIALPVNSNAFRLTRRQDELCGFARNLNCLDTAVSKASPADLSPPDLPCSIVHTRSHQISLLSCSDELPSESFMSPWREDERGPPFEGEFQRILTPEVPQEWHAFKLGSSICRASLLNMCCQGPNGDYGTFKYARQIPELGVVIAASDAGYAGIFTLTRLFSARSDAMTPGATGMRLDCIVPLDEQVPRGVHELHGLNLWSGLVGIATAPMQGALTGRFRLILEYGDRTVLCYELSRSH